MTQFNLHMAVAAALVGVGAFLLIQGAGMPYYGRLGPGSGFFPLWVGGLLTILSLGLLAHAIHARLKAVPALAVTPERSYLRPLLLGLSGVAMLVLLPLLGFKLTILLFLLGAPNIIGRQKIIPTIAVALVGSFGVAYVFEALLRVRLPAPAFELLRSLGL